MHLSAIDREILNYVQEDIPLCPAPFKAISERLGIEEENLIERVKELKEKGVIRRFAARINHRKLGFKSTLMALKIAEDKIETTAKEIVKYKEVTHCYLRKGEYNIWFVFISSEEEKIKMFLNELAERFGKDNIMNFNTRKQFKLNTSLNL